MRHATSDDGMPPPDTKVHDGARFEEALLAAMQRRPLPAERWEAGERAVRALVQSPFAPTLCLTLRVMPDGEGELELVVLDQSASSHVMRALGYAGFAESRPTTPMVRLAPVTSEPLAVWARELDDIELGLLHDTGDVVERDGVHVRSELADVSGARVFSWSLQRERPLHQRFAEALFALASLCADDDESRRVLEQWRAHLVS